MEVSLIRIYLLAGLILHKAVWEILKRRGAGAAPAPAPASKARVLSLIKIAILAGIVAQTLAPEIAPISSQPQTLRAVGIAIYTLGLMMAVVARCQLGRNWSDIEKSRVKRDHMLVAHGIYRWVRHPIYAGDLLLLLGLELALNSWTALGVSPLALYVRQKAASEERDLARMLAGYDDYCRRTPAFCRSCRANPFQPIPPKAANYWPLQNCSNVLGLVTPR